MGAAREGLVLLTYVEGTLLCCSLTRRESGSPAGSRYRGPFSLSSQLSRLNTLARDSADTMVMVRPRFYPLP